VGKAETASKLTSWEIDPSRRTFPEAEGAMKGALQQIESEKPESNEKVPSETDGLACPRKGLGYSIVK